MSAPDDAAGSQDAVRRFVALGDSFTEGLQDELGADGRHRGWADRVAAALAVAHGGLEYANLAVRGRLLDAVVTEQLPLAEQLGPDLVSFHAGANDVLRPRVDLPLVLDRYEAAVNRITGLGSQVLLFTVISRTGGTGRTADVLAARFAAFNDRVRAVAGRHGALLVDLGAAQALQDRRLWHEDRLHLGPDGHARVAAAALEALGVCEHHVLGGEPGWWRGPLPERLRRGRGADLVDDVRWVHRHFLPWAMRRLRGVSSGDGLLPKQAELVNVLPPA